jgi:hypothetical protein
MRPVPHALPMWIVCIHALIKGGWAERLVALTIFLGDGLPPFLAPNNGQYYRQRETGIASYIVMFIAFFAVGLFRPLLADAPHPRPGPIDPHPTGQSPIF